LTALYFGSIKGVNVCDFYYDSSFYQTQFDRSQSADSQIIYMILKKWLYFL